MNYEMIMRIFPCVPATLLAVLLMTFPFLTCCLNTLSTIQTVEKPETSTPGLSAPIDELRVWLKASPIQRPAIQNQSFASKTLTKEEAQQAKALLWDDFIHQVRETKAQEWKSRCIQLEKHSMKFDYRVFGEKPKTGRSLVISLHGGGSSPKAVNDQQWENQKRLYKLEEGIYLAPRAPTDAWDMWHQRHMDPLLEQLILEAMVFEDVDPDRIYLTGYSAGGDGVYRLAPRLADHWAAAAMMAGHPGDADPRHLRNLPFAIHMGERDSAFQRNQQAKNWKKRLEDLRKADPEGFLHEVEIHAGKGHWMDRQDARAMKWMSQFRRQPLPDHVIWQPGKTPRKDFYWLGVTEIPIHSHAEVIATRKQSVIRIKSKGIASVNIRLNDEMANLDQPITIEVNDKPVVTEKVQRMIMEIHQSIHDRRDPRLIFSAQVVVRNLE